MRTIGWILFIALCGSVDAAHVMRTHRNILDRFNTLENRMETCAYAAAVGASACCAATIGTYYLGSEYAASTLEHAYPYTTYTSIAGVSGSSLLLGHNAYHQMLNHINDEASSSSVYITSSTCGIISGLAIGSVLASHL